MADKGRRTVAGALRGGSVRGKAAVASLVWAVVVGAYAIGFFGASQARGTAFLDSAFFLVALVLPLMLTWIAALLSEELLRQRALIGRLADLVGASPAPAGRDAGDRAEIEAGFARLAAGQDRIAAALETLSLRAAPAQVEPAAEPRRAETAADRPRPKPPSRARSAPPPAQPDLPTLAEPEPEAPLDWDDLMRALDFPRDEDDREGFRALRLALRRHTLAQMLQAAEDVLTLLAQDGLYIDDLAFGQIDAHAWRRFVAGGRGAEVAEMGAVADAAALEAARASMKADPIFRDAALFFQRRFDAVLVEIASDATDAEFARLADTRSGRAFRLMAGASGAFD